MKHEEVVQVKVFSNLIKRYKAITAKQFILAGIFMLALAGSIGLGFANQQNGMAAVHRDCDSNSINREAHNGGCGAASPAELVADARTNKPVDLQMIYTHFGLSPGNYDRFAASAKQGEIRRNGDVVVDGQVVMTGAWTMGREKFNNQREEYRIKNNIYYTSPTQYSFASGVQSLPVMVMFDANGVVEVAIMNDCGNPLPKGNKVTPKAVCKAINQTQPDKVKKPNTYQFTTNAEFSGNAVFSRVVYTFSDDNTVVEKRSLTEPVEHTFKKSGKVTATVYAKVPGGREIQAQVINCEKEIKYVPPFFVCTALIAATIDQQKRSFRFTVKVQHDATTSLKDVDFTENGTTTRGVTTKDGNGNIYKEYTFTDDKEHTVVAKVNFNTREGVKSAECQAKVTPKKEPKCEVPGFEHLPPNDERCGYCKPGIPKGDDRCKEVLPANTELPKTGAGSVIGLFAGTTVVAAVGHRFIQKRRASRHEM
jgi:hypothetical protein